MTAGLRIAVAAGLAFVAGPAVSFQAQRGPTQAEPTAVAVPILPGASSVQR